MKKLEIYFLGEILVIFFISLFVLFGSFNIVQIGGILKNTTTSIKLSDILEISANIFPLFLFYFSFPLTLLSFFIVTVRMQKRGEIVALLSSGISYKPLLKTFYLFAVIILELNVYNIFYLLPKSKYFLNRKSLQTIRESTKSLLQKEGFSIINKQIAVFVKKSGNGNNLILYSEKKEFPVILSAEDVHFEKNVILFNNGVIIPLEKNKENTEIIFNKGKVPTFFLIPFRWKRKLTVGEKFFPDLLKVFFNNPLSDDLSIEVNRRLIFALSPILICWIALLPLIGWRKENFLNHFLMVATAFLIFYILTSTGRDLLDKGKILGTFVMWGALFSLLVLNELSYYIIKKRL